MKNHLKRIAAPSTWVIDRHVRTFIVKPNPGAHREEMGLALGVILRDNLKLAMTMNEVRKILQTQEVLVDGRRRLDFRFIVGLFDVLSIPTLGKQYRMVMDSKGRLVIKEISSANSALKVCRVVGKHVAPGAEIVYRLHDGKNVKGSFKAAVGDSVVVTVADNKVKEVLPLATGCCVFLIEGKHAGKVGLLKDLTEKEVVLSFGEQGEISTAKRCAFVVGKKTPAMEL